MLYIDGGSGLPKDEGIGAVGGLPDDDDMLEKDYKLR
jgi:hypothetical protein